MKNIRPWLIKIIFLLQVILSPTAGFCTGAGADTDTTTLWTIYGFSPFITDNADSIQDILITTKTLTEPTSVDVFFKILDSNWGEYNDLADYTKSDRIQLDNNFNQLGMHQARRELIDISSDDNRGLLIYLGAHPSILCSSLSELESISDYVEKALIVGSAQQYDPRDFANCHNFKQKHHQFFKQYLPGRASQREIMYAYLHGAGIISPDTVSLKNDNQDMSNSERLRLYLSQSPEYLGKFNKIIIVATQPHAMVAELVVTKNKASNSSISRIYTLSEMNINEYLNALRSLLKTDHYYQQKSCCLTGTQ